MNRLKLRVIAYEGPNPSLSLGWDDLWLGVKGYTNSEIAGFSRKKFKFYVHYIKKVGVKHSIFLLSENAETLNTILL